MHELSIAQSLLAIVLEEAEAHQATRVTKVGVKVGAFAGVVPSSLKFSFDLVKEDTAAAQAELVIEEVPMAGVCRDCGAELDMSRPVFTCPECDSKEVEMTSGRELYIDYLETD